MVSSSNQHQTGPYTDALTATAPARAFESFARMASPGQQPLSLAPTSSSLRSSCVSCCRAWCPSVRLCFTAFCKHNSSQTKREITNLQMCVSSFCSNTNLKFTVDYKFGAASSKAHLAVESEQAWEFFFLHSQRLETGLSFAEAT